MLNLRDPPQQFGIEVPISLLLRADGVSSDDGHFQLVGTKLT